jgi:hypothetical protein
VYSDGSTVCIVLRVYTHVYPPSKTSCLQLADVLTDCLGADDTFDLTAPLYGMEANSTYSRCLEESDFLNVEALVDANEPLTELIAGKLLYVYVFL